MAGQRAGGVYRSSRSRSEIECDQGSSL
jgi:hypothetical protein